MCATLASPSRIQYGTSATATPLPAASVSIPEGRAPGRPVRHATLATDDVSQVPDRLVPAGRVRDAERADENRRYHELLDLTRRGVHRMDARFDPRVFAAEDPHRVRDLARCDEMGPRVLDQVALDRERVEVVAVDMGDENQVDVAEDAQPALKRVSRGSLDHRVLRQAVPEEAVDQNGSLGEREPLSLVG